jgi:cell wall-associated NlpC family hydrolase
MHGEVPFIMNIHSTQNRILFFKSKFNLTVSDEHICSILESKGIIKVEADTPALAESLLGRSWKWGARQWQAPQFFDCSSFSKWVFGHEGLWLPRRPEQQFRLFLEMNWVYASGGAISLKRGDIVFVNSVYTDGKLDPKKDPNRISHVLVALGNNELVCAANSELGRGVVKTSFSELVKTRKILGVGRLPRGGVTFEYDPKREIETDEDVSYIVKRGLR